MKKNSIETREELQNTPTLVILVGESGVGKSTFAKAIGCKENWFESSGVMKRALKTQGIEPTHDAIHAFAKNKYEENPHWQVENILNALQEKDFLIYDGPRNAVEVECLVKFYPNTLIVKIVASDEARYQRLQKRDRISFEEFQRVKNDEAGETDLDKILGMADRVILNNGSIEGLQRKAINFKKFLEGSRNAKENTTG